MEATPLFEFNFGSWQMIFPVMIGFVAMLWDLKYRKIPNWLTFPAMIVGITYNLILNSRIWYFSVLGLLAGFLILIIPHLLGGIGAGDVKLLMAFGAFVGPRAMIGIGLYSGLIGGLMALFALFNHYGFWNARHQLGAVFSSMGDKENRKIVQTPNLASRLYIPYGPALFIGLLLELIWKPWWG